MKISLKENQKMHLKEVLLISKSYQGKIDPREKNVVSITITCKCVGFKIE